MSVLKYSYLIFLIIKGENTALIPRDNDHGVFDIIFRFQKYI